MTATSTPTQTADADLLAFLDEHTESLTHALRIAADADDATAAGCETNANGGPTLAAIFRQSATARRALATRLTTLADTRWAAQHPEDTTPTARTCTACGATIEPGPGVWVDTRSGDDGGTYDICPARYDESTNTSGTHRPRP